MTKDSRPASKDELAAKPMDIHRMGKRKLLSHMAMLGPLPILSSEDKEQVELLYHQVTYNLQVQDMIELLSIYDVVYETVVMNRLRRFSTMLIERWALNSREAKLERAKALKTQREQRLQKVAERLGQTPVDIANLIALDDNINEVIDDVDNISQRRPNEIDHNSAFERSLELQEKIDRMLNSAMRRRNGALQTLEIYRTGMGLIVRDVIERIERYAAEEEEKRLAETQEIPAPPTVPVQEVANDDIEAENSGQSPQQSQV